MSKSGICWPWLWREAARNGRGDSGGCGWNGRRGARIVRNVFAETHPGENLSRFPHIMVNDDALVWVQCYCWFFNLLPVQKRQRFLSLLREFIGEMKFVGVGIEVTEEIKIAVGGWAVLLVLNRPLGINWYRHIERIVIYPGRTVKSTDALGKLALGSHYCQVNLAWRNVRDSATKPSDCNNTILHEFAHALDHIDREIDGLPYSLLDQEAVIEWKRVFSQDFIHSKRPLRRYALWKFFNLGAWKKFDPNDSSCVDIGELFAVSTEMFYETPVRLKKLAPEIYQCLMKLYRMDTIVEIPKRKSEFKRALSTALNKVRRIRKN